MSLLNDRFTRTTGALLIASRRAKVRIFAAFAVLLLIVALLPPRIAAAGMAITVLTLLGYAALLTLLALFVFPVRIRQIIPGGPLRLGAHRQVGFAALLLGALHGVGYLIIEPVTWHDLGFSAPLYMLAGTIALIGLAALTLLSRSETRIWLTHARSGFRGHHLILSALILLLAGLHAGGSGWVLDASWKMRVWAFGAAIALFGLLRRARHPKGER